MLESDFEQVKFSVLCCQSTGTLTGVPFVIGEITLSVFSGLVDSLSFLVSLAKLPGVCGCCLDFSGMVKLNLDRWDTGARGVGVKLLAGLVFVVAGVTSLFTGVTGLLTGLTSLLAGLPRSVEKYISSVLLYM